MTEETTGHIPVLLREVGELLAVKPGETVVDATVGLGGHAKYLSEALGPSGHLIGLDLDFNSLVVAKSRLENAACRWVLLQTGFGDIVEALASIQVTKVDVILADLGMNSAQLDDPARGFSFQRNGPLDMRMNTDLSVTAAELVNRLREKDLGDLIFQNAQEPGGRRIARRICEVRKEGRITTTGQLADVVAGALGVNPDSRKSKIHPATRTFLALRMAVNDEMGQLEKLLEAAPSVLSIGGRIGVISFHSVEDKMVKLDFRKRKNEKTYRIVTTKPMVASNEERRTNPRSRSAKFRVAVREAVE
ncbi:MAG: 16S rRNA (cytosine(1402)-N(4))-methyltransferase RsmH [Planctomycetota bacterium]